MSRPGITTPHCHVLTIIDGTTEEVVEVEEIKAFDLHAFCHQFDVPIESDPNMLDRYSVGPGDAAFVQNALGLKIPFDFTRYAYFIEAVLKDV